MQLAVFNEPALELKPGRFGVVDQNNEPVLISVLEVVAKKFCESENKNYRIVHMFELKNLISKKGEK